MIDEQYLIPLLQNQNRKAIALLYDRYGAALYGVVLRIVGEESIAEDVMQETFMKVWKNGQRYDKSKGRLFTWLLNIARNTAIDVIRSSHYRRKNNRQPIDEQLQNNHQYAASLNIDHIGLKAQVEDLDEKYRKVIDLVYFNGYTHQEVQKELNIPLGTVKNRLKIGLRELRKVYLNAPVSIIIMLAVNFWFTFGDKIVGN